MAGFELSSGAIGDRVAWSLLDLIDEGVLILSPDERVLFVNRSAARLFGCESREIVGRLIGGFLADEAGFGAIRLGDEGCRCGRLRIRRPDGRGVTVFCERSAVLEGGQLLYLLRVREIESWGAEDFSESECSGQWRKLVDSFPIMVWMANTDGSIDYANPRFLEYTGITGEEPLGDQWPAMIHPEDVDGHIRKWRESVRAGAPFVFESRIRSCGTGEYRWFQVRALPIRDRAGLIFRWHGTAIDIHETKTLEAEASSLARRLSGTLENISDGFLILDSEWRFIYLNGKAEELLQRGKETLLGRVVWEEYPEVKELSIYPEYLRAVRTGIGRRFEEFYPPVGRWYSMNIHPVEEGLAVYFRDITEQRAAADYLRMTEERFRRFVKATQDVIWEWDPERLVFSWTENVPLFGYDSEEFTSGCDGWSGRVHPDDLDRVVASFQEALREGSEWACDYRFRRKNGKWAVVADRAHIIRDREGKVLRVIGGLNDRTVQSEREQKLREQAALLDNARDAILVTDPKGKVLYLNRSAEQLYGRDSESSIGMAAGELFHGTGGKSKREISKTLRDGEWIGENEHFSNGKRILVEERWTLVRDDAGEAKSILMINTDITGRKKLETQILRSQRLGSIGTLASGIAHDLNNIFAPIRMGVDLLMAENPCERAARVLTMIQGSAERGTALVRQILGFARGVEGERGVVMLTDVLREVTAVIRDTFPKSIELRLEVSEGLWRVRADANQMHQVLMNLCLNARDAMNGQGVLGIRLRNCSGDEIGCGEEVPYSPSVLIEVEDTGGGIEEENREQIFDPFFTTKKPGEGTGLGLSTVLMIVRGHGGVVNVYSEVGRGTVFKVYLPATGEEAAPDLGAGKSGVPAGRNECILVVDDEVAIRHVTEKTLEKFGYSVLTAGNGVEGLRVYRENRQRISLVLTDMAMPEMDGRAMIDALKKESPEVRILASSGLAVNDLVTEELAGKIVGFVAKPYATDHLLRLIRSALDR